MNQHVSPSTDRARTGILVSMCLALVLVVASVSSVNLALTGISLDLGTTSSQLTWIADGYTVALAALVLPFGALGDRFGRRTLLLIGTVVFGIAALLAAASQTAGALIACRALMGVGAAMIMPGTLSTITAAFPASRRAKAVSVWAGVASSGAILGLLTCGTILEWWSWRATFVATGVLAGAAFVTGWLLSPNTADPDEAVIDLPGYLLSALGVGALIFGIIDGAEAGWTTRNAVAGLAVAAASLLAFVMWELRTPRPMLDVRLFALRGFSTGTLALTVQFLCLFGFFLVGLQFLQLMLGYSALVSAVCLLPLGAVVMPLSRVAPHVVDRLGQRHVMTAGLTLLGAGLVVMSQLSADSSYWHFLGGLLVFGLGMAFTSTPATTAIVSSLPRAKQGVGSAMNDVSRELGSALGIAILGSLFNSAYSGEVSAATKGLPPEAAHAVEESAGAGLAVSRHLGAGGDVLGSAVRDAFAAGLNHALVAGAAIAFLAAGYTCWRGPRRVAALDVVDIDQAELVTVGAP
ncbi:MAG: MFS transporter [Actinobacteria bacterium]|nr:MFS transporter [Actinomycetota bacterium]